MSKITFVDLDMVVADCSHRFTLARQAKIEFVQDRPEATGQEIDNFYWGQVFRPELLKHHTLMNYVVEDLEEIRLRGYRIVFLTSRPDSLYYGTLAWLKAHGLNYMQDMLVCKADAFVKGYTKSVMWKIGMIQQLTKLFDMYDVLFVDDQHETVEALKKEKDSFDNLIVAHSLSDAVRLSGAF